MSFPRQLLAFAMILSLILQTFPGTSVPAHAQSEPLKSPVTIDLPQGADKLSPAAEEGVRAIIKAAGQQLYSYSQFPIEIPQSIFTEGSQVIELNDLYQRQTSDEVQRLALGENGDNKDLSPQDLENIKSKGLIIVPSVDYPGMFHVWAVSIYLQKGSENINLSLLKDKGRGFWHLRVGVGESLYNTKNNRKFKDILSNANVVTGFRNMWIGARTVVANLTVGLVETGPKYTYAEVQHLVNTAKQEYAVQTVRDTGVPQDPYLKLFEEGITERLSRVVTRIYAEVESSWNDFRQMQETDPNRTEFKGMQAMQDEFASKKNADFMQRIQNAAPEIEAIGTGLTKALQDHARVIQVTFEGEKQIEADIAKAAQKILADVQTQNPVRAQTQEWLDKQVEAKLHPVRLDIYDRGMEEVVNRLKQEGLETPAKVVAANYQFLRNESAKADTSMQGQLTAQLEGETAPARTIRYNFRIWNPEKWNIDSYTDRNGTTYFADKYTHTEVTSDVYFWRLWAAWNDGRYFFNNGLYHLIVSNFKNGGLGWRSLFEKEAFPARKELDPKTGLIVDSEEKTQTLRSRHNNLWNSIRQDRENFENSTNRGLLSKDVVRPFHIFKNTWIKGYLGTASLWAGQTALTGVNAGVTASLTVASVPVAAVTSLLTMGFNALVFDTTAVKNPRLNRFFPALSATLVKFGIVGFGQTVVGVLGTFYHGAAGIGKFGWGYIRRGSRTGYDYLMRNLLIRPFGRMPSENSSVAKRIEGPGLSSDYYFQVRPEIAVLGLQATLETIDLLRYRDATQAQIDTPLNNFKNFISEVFGTFIHNDPVQAKFGKEIVESTDLHTKNLNAAVGERLRFYSQLRGDEYQRYRIRQTNEDLAKTLSLGTAIVKDYYQNQYFKNLTTDEVKLFWFKKGLTENDWISLTRSLLGSTFSEGFLTPLQETDRNFRFVVEHAGLREIFDRYEGLYKGELLTPVVVSPVEKATERKVRDIYPSNLIPQTRVASTCTKYFRN